VSVVLLAAALLGIRAFYTYGYVEPYTKDQLLASLHLIENPQPHTVYREPPEQVLREAGGPASFARFKQRGVLRVCYVPGDYPSAFLNDAGDLVGFDVELAHRFARHLDVPLEFLPVGSIAKAEDRLNSSYCDVLMSLIAITPSRTEWFSMTEPILNGPVGLIVPDHRREAFRNWSDIRTIEGLRVGVLDDRSAATRLRRVLPNATPVTFPNKEDVDQILAAGAPDVDAIAMFAEEAAAWTLLHPEFAFVVPSPTIFIPSGYAVARGDTDLLLYLDTWLLNAKVDGTVDELYRYWMLGQVKQTQPPRWSVIRDVLGWVD
jgi:ABC-type amino acid transport substrate-binding protein